MAQHLRLDFIQHFSFTSYAIISNLANAPVNPSFDVNSHRYISQQLSKLTRLPEPRFLCGLNLSELAQVSAVAFCVYSTVSEIAKFTGVILRLCLLQSHYIESVTPNPEAGQTSIEQFLGPQLTATRPKCPQELHQRMTAPITATELNKVIKNFKKESCQGPLGISNSLLKEMSKFTTEILVKLGNDCLTMPHYQKNGSCT